MDDARLAASGRRRLHRRVELLGEQEVRQVVRLHLQVEAVRGRFILEGHDARVVCEHIEFRRRREDRLGRGANRRERHGVVVDVRDDTALSRHRLHVGERRLGPRRRPVQEEDVRRAFFREALGGDEARARGAACAAMAY